jgi:hypothetical protein
MIALFYLLSSWLLCFVTGVGTVVFLLPLDWQKDILLMAPVMGAGVLVLLSSLYSYGGMPMITAAPFICATALALSVWGGIAARHRINYGQVHWKAPLFVHALGFIGSASAAASVLLYHAWNPYNDAFTYISIADFLQGHSFFTPAIPGINHPVLTQMSIYQHYGFRMGSNFLLAFFTCLFRQPFSFDLYIPVLSLGLWIAVPGFWVFCRRALFMSSTAAVFATLIYSLHTAIPISNALWGFMPETWGIAFMLPLLALYLRLTSRGQRLRRIAVTGIFGGLLLLTYLEIVPFVLLAVAICYLARALMVQLRFRGASGPQFSAIKFTNPRFSIPVGLLLNLLAPIVVAAVVAPVAARKFVPAMLVQAGAVVGWDVRLSLVDYLAMLAGYRSMIQGVIMTPGMLRATLRLTAFLAVLTSAVAALRAPLRTRRQLACLASPFIAALAWFSLYAVNPWDASQVGNPWSTYKLVTYSFFLFVALWGVGLAMLWRKARFYRLLVVGQLAAFVGFFPVATLATAKTAAQGMQQLTGNREDPVGEYKRLSQDLPGLPRNSAVNLDIPSEALKHRQLVAYFLRRPVIADWSDDGYIWPHLSQAARAKQIDPTSPTLVYTLGKSGSLANLTLMKPGTAFATDSFGAGWWGEEKDGPNCWHWLEEKGELNLFVGGRGGSLTLRADLAVVGTKQRNVFIAVTEKPDQDKRYTLPERWFAPFTSDRIHLPAGQYHVRISADGPSYRFPKDPRPIRIGVRNLAWIVSPD